MAERIQDKISLDKIPPDRTPPPPNPNNTVGQKQRDEISLDVDKHEETLAKNVYSKQASATDNRTSITLNRSLIHTNGQVMQHIQVMHNHVNAKQFLRNLKRYL